MPIVNPMTWFVHHDEKILGPFTSTKILQDLKSGEISYGAYVWSKGQVEWIPVSDWEINLDALVAQSDSSKQKWKLRTPDETFENVDFAEVVKKLKAMENLNRVTVSQQNATQWVPIYSSYAFMEALNLSRRNFLRAPLMGLAKVTKLGSRFSYVVKTASLGQGGIGVFGLSPHFDSGMLVNIRIESEDLSCSINVNGSVVYNTDKGFIGIRFGDLPAESVAVIIEYLKRFHETEEQSQKAS